MTELAHTHRHGDRRFLRHAHAVTQAEIRRLSRLGAAAQPPHDAVETVQHELRRLSTPEAAAAGEPPRRR